MAAKTAHERKNPAAPSSVPAPPAFWLRVLSHPGFISILLAGITLAVFAPVARHDYVNYDDSDYVTANEHVQGGVSLANIAWAFTTGHASNWHPLTWISHMLDCQWFGQNAGAQHLVSLGFHIANTVLLFLLLRQMTGALWRCAFVAALFALHPIHVESVAWISERKDVLSTLFFLLTLWSYARYVREAKGGRPEAGNPFLLITQPHYALALVFFALGLMSKPMLVTLPFVLLLLDYWPLGRLGEDAASCDNRLKGAGLPFDLTVRLVIEKVPFFVLSLFSSVITFVVQRKGGAVSTALTFGERMANAMVSYVRYLGKMFWPQNLSVLYPHPGHWPAWQVAASGALLALIFAAVFWRARRQPYLAVGWCWFFGGLVPVIGFVQVGIQSMADRYTYVPMIGIWTMVTWALCDALGVGNEIEGKSQTRSVAHPGARNSPASEELTGFSGAPLRWALGIAAGLILFACAQLSARQLRYWRDSEALFRHATEATDRNYLAYNNLGFYLANHGKAAEAMENYRKSIEINPAYEDALNNLGYALAGQKKYLEALPYYEAALRAKPNHPEVHNNLGNALSELGRIDEAVKHYRIVLEQKPDHADAHNNLGIALAMQGKLDEAIAHFQAAIRFKPNYASAHSNLGNAFAVQHRLEAAIAEYQESLRLKPDDAQAHNNLGNALAEQGRVDDAIVNYREALKLNADNPEAHYNLGTALLRQGKRVDAAAHYTEALRLKPDYAQAKKQLSDLGVSSDSKAP